MSNVQNLDYPYFIIVAGPTASGKSSAIDKISNYFKNNELNSKKYTDFISIDEPPPSNLKKLVAQIILFLRLSNSLTIMVIFD